MKEIKQKLQQNRDAIDRIDQQLVHLFCARARRRNAAEQDVSSLDQEGECRLMAMNPGPLLNTALCAIFKELIRESALLPAEAEKVEPETVDAMDAEIVQLLNERARQAGEIGKIKHVNRADYFDPTREAQVMAKVAKLNPGPLSDAALQAIYREVISGSIALEKRLTIGYLGPEATYTHQAARHKFGASLDFQAIKTIPDVFAAVDRDEVNYGVIPIENSTEGAVFHSLDMLVESELHICSQVYLPIRHCLVSDSPLSEIVEVRSKDQALGQCRKWLHSNLNGVPQIDVVSTAEAVRYAKVHEGVAAVASELSAQYYGVNVQARDIEDCDDNITRFLVIGKMRTTPWGKGRDKTSLVISLPDECGALEKALRAFSSRGINLSKIESRPSRKKAWDYIFFIDLVGHYKDESVQAALAELDGHCSFVKWLGSYPNEPNSF